jgi:hypothetical protein
MAGRRFAARFRRRRHLTSHGTPTEGVSRAPVLSLNHVHSFWNEALPPQPKPFAKITTHASISTGDHPTTAKPIVGPQKEPPRSSPLPSGVVLVLPPHRTTERRPCPPATPRLLDAVPHIHRRSPPHWPPVRHCALSLAWETPGVSTRRTPPPGHHRRPHTGMGAVGRQSSWLHW